METRVPKMPEPNASTSLYTPPAWQQLLRERWLYGLLLLALFGTALLTQRSSEFRVKLDDPLHALFLEGFFKPDATPTGVARWSTGRADIRLPNLLPQQAVRLTLLLSAPRQDDPDPARRDQPVPAELFVNGELLAQWQVDGSPREYSVEIPAAQVGVNGDLFITLKAPFFQPPGDLRPLALLIGDIFVQPLGTFPFVPPLAILFSLSAFVCLFALWLRRLGASVVVALICAGVLLVAGWSGLYFMRPLIIPLLNRCWIGLGLVLIASETVVALTASQQWYRSVTLLFVLGVVPRLFLIHTAGDRDNFVAFKLMLENVTNHGVAAAYAIDPIIGAYPPVHHYFLAISGHIYRLLFSPEFDMSSMRLEFVMKLSTMVADTVVAMSILLYGLRTAAAKAALLASAAYFLNPGIIFVTAYHAQLGDPVYALFLLWAVIGLLTGQGELAGGATALAVLTKPQSSAFLPFLLLAALRHLPRRSLIRGIICGCVVSLLVLLPYLLAGTLPALIHTVSTTIGHGPRISSYAFNLWWLVGWGNAWEIKDFEPLIGTISYRTVGLVLFFGVAYGFIAWKTWTANKSSTVATLAVFTGLAFFLLPTEIHENYLYPTIPLLAITLVNQPRNWLPMWLLSISWFFNLTTTYERTLPLLTQLSPTLFGSYLFPVQVILAVSNLAMLLLFAYWLLKRPTEVVQQ